VFRVWGLGFRVWGFGFRLSPKLIRGNPPFSEGSFVWVIGSQEPAGREPGGRVSNQSPETKLNSNLVAGVLLESLSHGP